MSLPLTPSEARGAFAPLSRFSRLALAVSGGADSMAMLHLIARWRLEGAGKPELTVLTVDHGLRAGSRAEAEMVARMAKDLGLRHAILTWMRDERQSGGLQALAREARYDLMAAYCHANDIPALVTAHHLDDQAETFLMRLKRGSGLDGLAAIPAESVWSGIVVLRPLLDILKARLTATLTEAGLCWAEDPSNSDQRFERARMRRGSDALAKLELTPEALARSAQRLRRARAAIDELMDKFLAEHGVMSEAGYSLIARDALIAAPEEIALRALARGVKAVGGRAKPLRLAKLESLLASLAENSKRDSHARRLSAAASRRAPRHLPRDEGHWPPLAATRARATGAVGQPLQSRASAKLGCARHRQCARRISLARSPCLRTLAHCATALCRRHAASVLPG